MKNDAATLWSQACKRLCDILHPDVYSRWIAIIEPKDLHEETLTLAVSNDFYQTWLEENYLPLIKNAVASVCGFEPKIAFAIDHQIPEPEVLQPPKKSLRDRLSRRKLSQPVLNPRFIFEEFIVGPSNQFAHAASLAVAQAPARAYNPLFVYGGVGLGKTHLMQAIGHHVLSTSRATVCYLSSESFINEYIDALQNRSLVQFRKKYRGADLLLIDDIHFLAGKERLQEEFFHTFNTLFDAHKQIVMTSDRPAAEIGGLEQRLVSRFEWGLVAELESPDLETRIAILRHKQAQAKIQLSDEHILFIAHNIRSNIRRLEGALVRAISFSSLTNQPLTIKALEHLLRDILEQEKHDTVTFDMIQRAVAEKYDIRLADMTSTHRPRAIARPRQIAMYLCRRLTQASLPEIANAFGRTHATILHAYRSIDNKITADGELRRTVTDIAYKLGKKL